jgi:hypothetical protein
VLVFDVVLRYADLMAVFEVEKIELAALGR